MAEGALSFSAPRGSDLRGPAVKGRTFILCLQSWDTAWDRAIAGEMEAGSPRAVAEGGGPAGRPAKRTGAEEMRRWGGC